VEHDIVSQRWGQRRTVSKAERSLTSIPMPQSENISLKAAFSRTMAGMTLAKGPASRGTRKTTGRRNGASLSVGDARQAPEKHGRNRPQAALGPTREPRQKKARRSWRRYDGLGQLGPIIASSSRT